MQRVQRQVGDGEGRVTVSMTTFRSVRRREESRSLWRRSGPWEGGRSHGLYDDSQVCEEEGAVTVSMTTFRSDRRRKVWVSDWVTMCRWTVSWRPSDTPRRQGTTTPVASWSCSPCSTAARRGPCSEVNRPGVCHYAAVDITITSAPLHCYYCTPNLLLL